jgi:GGDEF domain-containing protein
MRFGFRAGDEILRHVGEHLSGFFAESRLLFRWRGPYLLGLIGKKADPRISLELQRLASMRLQHSLTTRGRELTLPISMNWTLIPLEAKSVEGMIHNLDELTTRRL